MSSEKDLRHPIKFTGQGSCPKCDKANMVLSTYSSDHIFLDEYGTPIYNKSTTKEFLVCPVCGYIGNIGEDYIKLEDGSYKFVTEAERIYEERRMANLPEITHLHAYNNPFIKEGE